MRLLSGAVLAGVLALGGCAKGAKGAAKQESPFRAAGAAGVLAGQPVCGNAIVDSGEDCDGESLNELSCQLLGYADGMLRCTEGCTFDVSMCLAPGAPGAAGTSG